MLRAGQFGYVVWCIVALAAGAQGVARSSEPSNPLRPKPQAHSSLHRVPQPTVWREPAEEPLAHSLVLAESLEADPPSIVPRSLANAPAPLPELLPAPEPSKAEPFWNAPGDSDLQQLVHPWLDEPWFAHSDPNDPHRHIGLGQPLIGTSWRNRPWFVGTFVGGALLDDLISNRVYQNDSPLVGLRLGYDFDHFWGLDMRWAFANPELTNGAGEPLADPGRNYFADASIAYFPFGDARWRPYFSAGLGFQTVRFNDDLGRRISESMLSIPLGIGVKYFYSPWFTMRFDLYDNLGLGNARVSGMHNFSLLAGAEFRFGARRQSYYPWHNNHW